MSTVYPRESEVIMALLDIQGFGMISRSLSSKNLFKFLNGYFEMIGRLVSETGGEVIKFIGDAALVVYPADSPRQAVGTLRNLRFRAEEYLESTGYENGVHLKAHIGKVYMGPLGTSQQKCLDIIGQAVHELFRLPDDEFTLSTELDNSLKD